MASFINQILLLQAATVVLNKTTNAKQIVLSPISASSISVSNNSTKEYIKVTVIPIDTSITSGGFVFGLTPLESLDIEFGQRNIKQIEVQAVNEPQSTMNDENLTIKTTPLDANNGKPHLVGVRFLGERLDGQNKNCV